MIILKKLERGHLVKIACGTDIIEIERIKKSMEKLGEKFLNKIYTKQEIEYCESKKVQKYQSYAGRFAVKEAVFKAISFKLKDKYQIDWKDIETINNEQGKPELKITGIDMGDVESVDVSISHCKTYAIANVTVIFS